MIKKRKFVKYIFLNIITLGIYGLFFWYKRTEDLNRICDGDDNDSANYLLVLLLNIFSLSVYLWVWNYKMAERMYQIAPSYGKQFKHGGLFVLIWRFFLPIVSSYYKIKYINVLAECYNAARAEAAENAEAAPAAEAPAAFEEEKAPASAE